MTHSLKYATTADVETYKRDGVVCLRGVFENRWIDLLRAAWDKFEHAMENDTLSYSHMAPFFKDDPLLKNEVETLYSKEMLDKGRETGFISTKWMFLCDPDLQNFVRNSPAAQIVGEVLDINEVRFFWDQMFVKKANVGAPTYWHTDMPAWPMQGAEIPSFWIPLTPVDKDLSALEFVRGSHLTYDPNDWPRTINARKLERPKNRTDFLDVEALRKAGEADVISFDMEPGDVLVIDPRLYHGGGANNHPTQERIAISTRWLGPDVTWDPRPECLNVPGWPHDKMVRGQAMKDDALFPVIWRREKLAA